MGKRYKNKFYNQKNVLKKVKSKVKNPINPYKNSIKGLKELRIKII